MSSLYPLSQDSWEDIRPYEDREIPDAMRRIASSKEFSLIVQYLFPDKDPKEMKTILGGIKTCEQFQWQVMAPVVESLERQGTDGVVVEGLDRLDKDKRYLFIANHRDIVLDASFLTYHLAVAGLPTPEITFGANLMQGQLVIDVGRSNKMFKVERPSTAASPRDFYMFSKRLSGYIRHTLGTKKESIWIAQRNGRTKDGDDLTDPGIIKMFEMSSDQDKVDCLSELNLTPVSISYEWEPCDILKALELYETRSRAYVKKPGEDLNSILRGILQQKGRVSIVVCPTICEEELDAFSSLTLNRFNKEVAELVDRRIHSAYRLFPNNYIAHDIRFGQKRFTSNYTPQQMEAFILRLKELEKYDYQQDVLRDIFLGIYSNPVDNVLRLKKG